MATKWLDETIPSQIDVIPDSEITQYDYVVSRSII